MLVFEKSKEGRGFSSLPACDVPEVLPKEEYRRGLELHLPEISENDLSRHYTELAKKSYGVNDGFYPLGSCTMKYNPKINEDMAGLPQFTEIHPLQPESTIQGCLEVIQKAEEYLCEITGMNRMTMQPAAGAHGEFTGLLLIKAYHESRGDHKRTKIIVPDSAHGTNPASATMAGYSVVSVPSMEDGCVDLEKLRAVVGEDTAGLMLTNPNTVGLFDKNILEITDIIHECGGVNYYDGANLNAVMGIVRPGDMGFDVIHLNLHKTFSTPHGGGGPGSGPVGVKECLLPFLPVPVVEKDGDRYHLNWDVPKSIGKVKDFYGHFGIMVRAYTYILTMGSDGLKRASEVAVLNTNYIKERLKEHYYLPLDTLYKHEVVFSGLANRKLEVTTLDIAKRILDKGFHAPTVYFPLIVDQAIMIEPTETESKETLDQFIQALIEIAEEAEEDISILKEAPLKTLVRRPDETLAAKQTIVKYEKEA